MGSSLVVRCPQDFIALAPVVLGFQPQDSLVMITMGQFHARVDLPEDAAGEATVINTLLQPTQQHNVKQAAVLTFSSDGNYTGFLQSFVSRLRAVGVDVVAALEVQGDQFKQLGSIIWKPADVESSPVTLDAQFRDVLPCESRESVAESIRPRGGEMSDVQQEALAILREVGVSAVALDMRRESVKNDVTLWSGVLRNCEPGTPEQLDVALLLAFASWLSGDGAKAWMALDLADSTTEMHMLLQHMLQTGRNPADWQP